MKNVCILGSTGSIGQNALHVLEGLRDEFRVVGLSSNSNVDLLRQQIARFRPGMAAVTDAASAATLRRDINGSTAILSGEGALQDLVRRSGADVVINGLVGFAGLLPTIEAVTLGKNVALANKETLVVAGELIMRLAGERGAGIIPIDSEHSAILQCLAGEERDRVQRLILTASGGPFLHHEPASLRNVSVAEALRHPNWSMGKKITIDSATMMNKGLEIIEAHWLFGLPADRIDVLIHPQSVIHSMVEFVDGSVKAQLGVPDMKVPIQYALTHPGRSASAAPRIDFHTLGTLTFMKADDRKFPCLRLAYEALRAGGTAPAVLNGANEVAVRLFLDGKISFTDIPGLVGAALEEIPVTSAESLETIIEHDTMARATAMERSRMTTGKMTYAAR